MAGTAADMLRVARSQIGVKESPRGSNKVKYTKWYGLVGPWCAMFISWVARQAGVPKDVIPTHAYTPSGRNFFRNKGRHYKKPKVGDIVYYQFPGFSRVSHVGLVEKVHSDGSWTAIEGNTDAAGGRTGGQVMRKRRRTVGRLGGFGRPAYKKSTAKPKASTPSKPKTPAKPGKLDVDGSFGPATIRELQRVLKVSVDGGFGPKTKKALQRKLKVTADGVIGPKTVKALQRKVGAGVDGAWGKATTKKLQTALNNGKF